MSDGILWGLECKTRVSVVRLNQNNIVKESMLAKSHMTEPSSPIIAQLKALIDARAEEIQHWLEEQRAGAAPFIYTSVDVRHSGFKIAPVDTNLFPAGFNNLSTAARHRASVEFKHYFSAQQNPPKRILIIPENHTRNLGYLENLHVLKSLLEQGGCDVRIGSFVAEVNAPLTLETLGGATITEFPLIRDGNALKLVDGFSPDAIVLNNDLTAGMHPLLEKLSTPIFPPPALGWWKRRKSEHFEQYAILVREFCNIFAFDPWIINAAFHRCGVVQFDERRSLEKVAAATQDILDTTNAKYREYGITETPYVFVKADSGTYGMGIMTARSAEELLELNKKNRNKMKTIKEGTSNTEVIIQEGVPTIDRVEGAVAEPMLYLVNGHPVGGSYRVNSERDGYNNLNATGMRFAGMCDQAENDCNRVSVASCDFGVFGLVASLAALAAARENYRHFDYAI